MKRSPQYVELYVVYEAPADFRAGYVLRRWCIIQGVEEPVPDVDFKSFPDLPSVRRFVREALGRGVYRLEREPGEDRVIVEKWINPERIRDASELFAGSA